MSWTWVATILGVGVPASAGLIMVLMPLLRRYALARPNARSSHVVPTPQGAGIAVILVSCLAIASASQTVPVGFVVALLAATLALALLGALDDIWQLPVLPRFLAQAGLIIAVMASMPSDWRLAPVDWAIPLGMERGVLVLALWWFVNLTNFIDGLDWITAANMVPAMLTVSAIGLAGEAPAFVAALAAGLAAGLLGFTPFNKPPAAVFLGDVGSLPVGLLAGVALIGLAAAGHLAAAVLLAAYPALDATITLIRRAALGERVWEAHRSHFYQRATVNGYDALAVSTRVLALNVVLCGLAGLSVWATNPWVDMALALTGLILAAGLCGLFSRPR